MGHEYWYYFIPIKEGTDIKEFEEHLNEHDEWDDDKERRQLHGDYISDHAPRYQGECEYAWVNIRWLDDFTYCYWEEIENYFKDGDNRKIVRKIDKQFKDDIKELMSGNICRCGAYTNIVTAIQEVMQQEGGPTHE